MCLLCWVWILMIVPVSMAIFNRWRGWGHDLIDPIEYRMIGLPMTPVVMMLSVIGLSYYLNIYGNINIYWYVFLTMVNYIIGESFGWGKWMMLIMMGDLPTHHSKYQAILHSDRNALFIHETVNLFFDYETYPRLYAWVALALRGLYWWLPVYLIQAAYIGDCFLHAIIAALVTAVLFPVASWIGFKWPDLLGHWKYLNPEDTGQIMIDTQELCYGFFAGIVFVVFLMVA